MTAATIVNPRYTGGTGQSGSARSRRTDPRTGQRDGWAPPRAPAGRYESSALQNLKKGVPYGPPRGATTGPSRPQSAAPKLGSTPSAGHGHLYFTEEAEHGQSHAHRQKHPKAKRELSVVAEDVLARIKPTHNTSALAAILPHNYTTRYQAGWANTPTSVTSPFAIHQVDFSKPKGANAELAAGSFFCAVSRDPLNAFIMYVPNPEALLMYYVASFPTYDVADTTKTPVVRDKLRVGHALGVPHPVNPCVWNYSAGLKVHGPVMYTRSSSGDEMHKYTYMTKGENIRIATYSEADVLTGNVGVLGVVRWNGETFDELQEIEFGTPSIPGPVVYVGTVDFTAPESGNYGFYIGWIELNPAFTAGVGGYLKAELSANKADAPVGGAAVHSHLAHRPLPGIQQRVLLSAIRVNGRSLMVTPDSVMLARGGRIAGAQLDTTFQVESLVKNCAGGDATNTVANLDNAVTINYDRGGYAFHKPRSSEAYKRSIPFLHNNDFDPRGIEGFTTMDAVISNYKSEIDSDWLVYAITTPPNPEGGSVDFPGGLAHITESASVEYWHYDMWIGKALPPLGHDDFNDVMELVGLAPQFHENALHVADLKRWYNSASPKVKMIAPALFKLMRAVGGPIGGNLAAAAETVGQMLPETWN